ncbi:MAG: adenosylmethionine decarboxylase [Candidatus Woesearchaeota archaeon]
MSFIHVLLDGERISFDKLSHVSLIEPFIDKAVQRGNFTILEKKYHQFEPYGVTGFYLLSESHISVHTWPELGKIRIDIFSCSKHENVQNAVLELQKHFENHLQEKKIER